MDSEESSLLSDRNNNNQKFTLTILPKLYNFQILTNLCLQLSLQWNTGEYTAYGCGKESSAGESVLTASFVQKINKGGLDLEILEYSAYARTVF